MRFSFHLVVAKGLRKKKKKVQSKSLEIRRRRRIRAVIKPDSKLLGIDNIPDDLLMNILSRLQAKEVTRSLCVSNLWYSLIASSHFTNLFLASPSSAKPLRFIFYIVDKGNLLNHAFLSSSFPHDHHSNPSFSLLDQVLDIPGMGGYIVNALHGLLCGRIDRKIQICNLTTYQRVFLPIIKSQLLVEPNYDIWNYFGYDHVHREYKVLNIVSGLSKEESIIKSEHQMLVLGPQASWRNTKGYIHPHRPYSKGILVKSVLYYRVWFDQNKCGVMSFNFTSEDFKLIELPVEANIIWDKSCCDLTNYKDKIAVFKYSNSRASMSIELWVMEDAKKMKWSKKTMVVPIGQMRLNNGDQIGMRGTSKSCEVLLEETCFHTWKTLTDVYFDLEKNKIIRRIQVRLPRFLLCSFQEFGAGIYLWEDNIENIMYLET